MSFLAWWTQRVGALSIFALLALSYYVLSREAAASQLKQQPLSEEIKTESSQAPSHNATSSSTQGAGIWTFIFAYYSLLVHIIVTFFPLRACQAIWQLTATLKKASRVAEVKDWTTSGKLRSKPRNGSHSSRGSTDTLVGESRPSSAWSDGTVDIELESYDEGEPQDMASVVHAIIIPNYKEEVDVLRETLDVLASHPRARTCYDVYLGMEEREDGSATKALGLMKLFVKKFRSIDFASHPGDIPGEAAGKSSNLAWAARKLSAKYSMEMRRDVIITGIDADSHLSSTYFATLAAMHLAEPETAQTTLYSAPIIFDRNAHQVAGLVRVADILWCAAGMSGLYRGSSIAPPTSVYSLPLELVDRVGGWDTDSESLGEDLHMYIKCFFALNGNLTCRTVPSPISSSNVSNNGGGGIRGSISDVHARYKQALRHMWGALDTGYAIRKTVEMWRERRRTTKAFRPLHKAHGNDGADLYVPDASQTMSDSIAIPNESGIFAEVTLATVEEPHLEHVFYLGMRLFEAHFLPVHMAILVFASAGYLWIMDGQDDPNKLMWTFLLSKILRTGSFMMIGCYMYLYESYHRVCVATREKEMAKAGLAEGMCFSRRSLSNLVDYALIPLVAPLYGTIPSFQAAIAHLWTKDLVYTVSKKVVRQRAKSVDSAAMA